MNAACNSCGRVFPLADLRWHRGRRISATRKAADQVFCVSCSERRLAWKEDNRG